MIPRELLVEKSLKQPTPDKVFRKVVRDDTYYLVPASKSIGIVLRHNLTKKPSLEELEKMTQC